MLLNHDHTFNYKSLNRDSNMFTLFETIYCMNYFYSYKDVCKVLFLELAYVLFCSNGRYSCYAILNFHKDCNFPGCVSHGNQGEGESSHYQHRRIHHQKTTT